MNRAVFVDRDGTVIRDCGYLNEVEGVEFLPGVVEALKHLRNAGFLLVLVTNQAGIGRGYVEERMVDAQHRYIRARLRRDAGIDFAGVEYCPHPPEVGCPCRKPGPGMLTRAARALDVDLAASFMVGDRESDVLAGKAAGTRTVLLGTHSDTADCVAVTLADAAAWIVAAREDNG